MPKKSIHYRETNDNDTRAGGQVKDELEKEEEEEKEKEEEEEKEEEQEDEEEDEEEKKEEGNKKMNINNSGINNRCLTGGQEIKQV